MMFEDVNHHYTLFKGEDERWHIFDWHADNRFRNVTAAVTWPHHIASFDTHSEASAWWAGVSQVFTKHTPNQKRRAVVAARS